jgi:NTE family protein
VTGYALVLGAGGYAASAWQIGLIAGMADSGVDIRDPDLLVGTSAGARVAVQLSSGVPLEDLVQRQIDPTWQAPEAALGVDWKQWRAELERAKEGRGGPTQILQRIGSLALMGARGSASERRKFIVSQLPVQTWPERKLRIVAVESETGERRVFDRTTGIELIDAVMASGAVAGIWPPVPFAVARTSMAGSIRRTMPMSPLVLIGC